MINLDVENLLNHIDQKAFSIRNGVGQGFVTQPELYNNRRLEIGLGSSRSGKSDWGGTEYALTSPIKLVIDANYNIIELTYDSFPDNEESEALEAKCKEFIGEETPTKLIVNKTSNLYDKLFNIMNNKLGSMEHIGINDDYKIIF